MIDPNIHPVIQDSFESLDIETLTSFEQDLGLILPDDYRAFLLEYNGGFYRQLVALEWKGSPADGLGVSCYDGLAPDSSSFDLRATRRILENYLPKELLAVADDGMGDKICVELKQGPKAEVWIWEHETGIAEPVVKGFREFVQRIRYFPGMWNETIPCFMAAERGDVHGISEFLPGELERVNDDGCTMLICASESCQPLIVEKLLEAGANIEAHDQDGNTPLIAACRAGVFDITKKLVQFGANLEARDSNGKTPLLAAMEGESERVTRYLIECGADTEAIDNYGNTAIACCMNFGFRDYVSRLLSS